MNNIISIIRKNVRSWTVKIQNKYYMQNKISILVLRKHETYLFRTLYYFCDCKTNIQMLQLTRPLL